jgi:hypothetical protein
MSFSFKIDGKERQKNPPQVASSACQWDTGTDSVSS